MKGLTNERWDLRTQNREAVPFKKPPHRLKGWERLLPQPHPVGFASIARGTSAARVATPDSTTFPTQPFLGRPPFLPHRERFLRYLRVVAFPPFLPMHRGQISLVMGCIEQYVSLRTTYFYPKRPYVKPPVGFFLPLPPCFPQSDSWSLCLSAVASPPPDAMHLGQISLVRE
jgi:hypothetical protein